LRKRGVEIEEIDYAKRSLDEATIRAIVAKAGSVAAVLNVRHATAKAKGWIDHPPDVPAFAKAAAAEPNLLRRPIVVAGDKVIVGFDEAAYRKL
jgi:arsenate reductase-like glutaredoxin family protein